MRSHPLARRMIPAPALALVLVLAAAIAACSNSSSSSASHTASGAASTVSASALGAGSATAQIKVNWEAFFSGTTPAAQKISLLQNGQEFASIINAQAELGPGEVGVGDGHRGEDDLAYAGNCDLRHLHRRQARAE